MYIRRNGTRFETCSKLKTFKWVRFYETYHADYQMLFRNTPVHQIKDVFKTTKWSYETLIGPVVTDKDWRTFERINLWAIFGSENKSYNFEHHKSTLLARPSCPTNGCTENISFIVWKTINQIDLPHLWGIVCLKIRLVDERVLFKNQKGPF